VGRAVRVVGRVGTGRRADLPQHSAPVRVVEESQQAPRDPAAGGQPEPGHRERAPGAGQAHAEADRESNRPPAPRPARCWSRWAGSARRSPRGDPVGDGAGCRGAKKRPSSPPATPPARRAPGRSRPSRISNAGLVRVSVNARGRTAQRPMNEAVTTAWRPGRGAARSPGWPHGRRPAACRARRHPDGQAEDAGEQGDHPGRQRPAEAGRSDHGPTAKRRRTGPRLPPNRPPPAAASAVGRRCADAPEPRTPPVHRGQPGAGGEPAGEREQQSGGSPSTVR